MHEGDENGIGDDGNAEKAISPEERHGLIPGGHFNARLYQSSRNKISRNVIIVTDTVIDNPFDKNARNISNQKVCTNIISKVLFLIFTNNPVHLKTF